jgi:hypothetical protein
MGGIRRIATIVAMVGAMVGGAVSPASAGVTYTATDLTGQNLWHYTYVVSGPLPENNAVNLLFDPTLYSELVVTGLSSGVDVLEAQPNPNLQVDGLLIISARSGIPGGIPGGAEETVDLDFLWLGVGSPGSQAYEVLDDQFNLLGTGETRLTGTQGVPEPPTLALLVGSLMAWLAVRRRQRYGKAIV